MHERAGVALVDFNRHLGVVAPGVVRCHRVENTFLGRVLSLQAVRWNEALRGTEHDEFFVRAACSGLLVAEMADTYVLHCRACESEGGGPGALLAGVAPIHVDRRYRAYKSVPLPLADGVTSGTGSRQAALEALDLRRLRRLRRRHRGPAFRRFLSESLDEGPDWRFIGACDLEFVPSNSRTPTGMVSAGEEPIQDHRRDYPGADRLGGRHGAYQTSSAIPMLAFEMGTNAGCVKGGTRGSPSVLRRPQTPPLREAR